MANATIPAPAYALTVGRVPQRLQQPDQHGAGFQIFKLVAPRLLADQQTLHLQNDVGIAERCPRIRGD